MATPGEPPVQVAALTARSDGSLVGVYGGPERIHYRIRDADGTWGDETTLPSETGDPLSGPQSVRGTDDTVHLAYTRRDGTAWYRRTRPDGTLSASQRITERPVVQNAVDSDQVGADAVAVDSTVHVLFVEASTGRLYHTRSDAGRSWAPPTLQVDSADVQWVRGRPVSHGASTPSAYGYVYDAGSDGGSGKNWYDEVPVNR